MDSVGHRKAPSWLRRDDGELRPPTHHVWKPLPMERSIYWTPIGPVDRIEPTDSYLLFIEQRAFETMYRHVWGSEPGAVPYGFLLGDLCEDQESRIRYVVVTEAIAATDPPVAEEGDRIAESELRVIRRTAARSGRVLAGWYQGRSVGPARLSAADVDVHRAHFPEDWQTAWVFVTDPEAPEGGCFRPGVETGERCGALPFQELASSASLRARGVFRTRIDWQNLTTASRVQREPIERPVVEIGRRADEPPPIERQPAEPEPRSRPRALPPPLPRIVPLTPAPRAGTSPGHRGEDSVDAPTAEPARSTGRARPSRAVLLEGVVAAAAVACMLVGTRPLVSAGSAHAEQPGASSAAVVPLVHATPAAGTERPLVPGDEPFAPLINGVLMSSHRYEAVAKMFERRRLGCDVLGEAYAAVDGGWMAYTRALAASRDSVSGLAPLPHQGAYRDVRAVELDFTASGCPRP